MAPEFHTRTNTGARRRLPDLCASSKTHLGSWVMTGLQTNLIHPLRLQQARLPRRLGKGEVRRER